MNLRNTTDQIIAALNAPGLCSPVHLQSVIEDVEEMYSSLCVVHSVFGEHASQGQLEYVIGMLNRTKKIVEERGSVA